MKKLTWVKCYCGFGFWIWIFLTFELPHVKTNKMACVPSEDSDQSGHSPSLIRVFAVHMKKAWVLSYPLSTQRSLWSDWAYVQADLSLHWAHRFCLVCHEAAHLNLIQVALHIPGAYNLTMHLPIIIGTVPYRRAQAFHFTDSHFYRETQAHFRAMDYLSVPDPPPYRETITPPPPFEGNKGLCALRAMNGPFGNCSSFYILWLDSLEHTQIPKRYWYMM